MKRLFDRIPIYSLSPEVETMQDAIQGALGTAVEYTIGAQTQIFVQTATWSLPEWEKMLGLPIGTGLSNAERRERIISKLRGVGTVTKAMVQNVASSYANGEVSVEEGTGDDAYHITITFVDEKGLPPQIDALKAALEEIIPAHLMIDYVVRFTTHGEIGPTWSYTHAQLSAYTHDEIRTLGPNNAIIYGFHIDGSESDPADAVAYLEAAAGKTPAHMDFGAGEFDYGGWADAFFMPRPCMLQYDGTVDYYLDPDDYTKKADGTASDVADDTYGGNAMMEWGRDGKKIWYKIVPDIGDDTSASVYIANYQADADYHCWSFINNQGALVDHFYTPIYNGSIDGNGKLRSISGVANTSLCNGLTATQEIAAAELNNPGADDMWYTETFADVTLINLLLILIGKTLDTQGAFGNGRVGQTTVADHEIESCLGTGTMDDKGLFYGSNGTTDGVKVFGMENWWGNQWRRYAGLVCNSGAYKYKLTYGTQDGSTQDGYVASGTATDYDNYLDAVAVSALSGYISAQKFGEWGFVPSATSGTASTYWCDNCTIGISSVRYVRRGGYASALRAPIGAFLLLFNSGVANTSWNMGACLSCKPTAS